MCDVVRIRMDSSSAQLSGANDYWPRLVSLKFAKQVFHGNGFFGRLNSRLATGITDSVGTMWCAYVFVIIACISLPDAIRSENPITIVAWVAQTFLQLVLLPIIIVGQNIQAQHSELLAKSDHKNIQEVFKLSTQIRANVAKVLELSKQNHKDIDDTVTQIQDTVVSSSKRLESLEAKIELLLQRSV